MNKIILQGIIKDIKFSHYIKDIEYYKATIISRRENNKEDIIPIKFKRFCNKYNEGENINIVGNVRTFSEQDEQGQNHVHLYVFTYFDEPEIENTNMVFLDGKICKKGELRKTKNGVDVIDFIVANNLKSDANQTFNTYLPIVAWGKQAKEISKLNIGDYINIEGHFTSRTYKKPTKEGFDIKIAYEVNVDKIL